MLIKCPECQRDISDTAKQCPHCGYSPARCMLLAKKLASLFSAVKSFFSFTTRKKELTPGMSPLMFFVYAMHNVSIDQDGFAERVRDYTVDEKTGVSAETLTRRGLTEIISRRILAKHSGVDSDGDLDVRWGDGVKIIDERDIDPYVDVFLPFLVKLLALDDVNREIRAAQNMRGAVLIVIRQFVDGLLVYEEIEYRYSKKMISGKRYEEELEALVARFSPCLDNVQ